MKRVLLQPSYVLHRRAYRETSFLVELFTLEQGRVTAVAKGVRKARSPMQGLLQPFIPLLISWYGKGELVTISQVELASAALSLRGERLFAGFYLNELLMRLLQKWDAHSRLYSIYAKTLTFLQEDSLEKTLRSFEKSLLQELGYGLLPTLIAKQPVFSPEKYYRFLPEEGFVLSETDHHSPSKTNIFSGKSLLAFAKEDWTDAESLQDAKRLIRFALAPLLGSRPLYSRQLFMQVEEGDSSEK